MVSPLLKYFVSLHYWQHASANSISRMQVNKFSQMFKHAGKHSKFFREYYGDQGVIDIKIRTLDDIQRIPKVSKALLKNHPIEDIMTREKDGDVRIHSTSGSSGEPFLVAFNQIEDYTAHVRVYWALRKAGFRLADEIVMITRYCAGDRFDVEKDISAIGLLQNRLHLLQREIISIYEPVDEIIAKLLRTKARFLWSTPSILQIVAMRLKEKGIALEFPIVFLTSEAVSVQQKKLFLSCVGKLIVGLYGTIESPSLGFDFGLKGRFDIFPNSNLFEFEPLPHRDGGGKVGRVVITNLINRTMPLIRYEVNDLAELEENPEFGLKYIGRIVGRQDDILELGSGKYLAHHHVHEMFMDFHECEMFKFVQRIDQRIVLQLKIADGLDRSNIEMLARDRWRRKFANIPLEVEFVDGFAVNPRTGKFKNMEKADGMERPVAVPLSQA